MRHEAILICHPATPGRAVRAIAARVEVLPDGALQLAFALDADLGQLRIPTARAPCEAHGLWQHTCFEAFLGNDDDASYCEFNFSPSSEWAVHGFSDYREGQSHRASTRAPALAVRSAAGRLELQARVSGADLPPLRAGVQRRLGLSAVIEDSAGRLSYWALKHPRERPDFHDAASFALAL